VTRATRLSLAFGASAVAHVALGGQLYLTPLPAEPPQRPNTFEVRMVTLPPPPPPRPPVAPEPPKPLAPPPKPEPVESPKPKPRPELPKPAPAEPPPAQPAAPPPPAAPEPTSAPPALLADSAGASGPGIVQRSGASVGVLAMASSATSPEPSAERGAPLRPSARLAKLSDLSRKPVAPSLDAALRHNYPAELRRRGMEGQAEVRVVIDPRGRVGELAVVSETASGFAEACKRTLLGSTWSEPLDSEGRPVSTRLTYRCRFQIER
jgi:periplasmic protein TonB